MPYKDPEKKKEYNRLYFEKNKETIRKQQKEYNQNNKDKHKQRDKEYYHTEHGRRQHKISSWKNNLGIILEPNQDWDSIYYFVESLDNCEECNKQFKNSKDRQLDHDHTTGFIRDVICTSCNVNRGLIDKNLISK